MSRIWVTRAEPGAAATALRLRELGFSPFVAPLIGVRPTPGGAIDLGGIAALAFTSANGVAAFAARSADRALPVYAVGSATAAAARAAGFARVDSADGDVEALAPFIAARGGLAGAVLHPGPAEAAGDLTGALEHLGVPARRLVVYESVDVPPDAATAEAIPGLAAALLHSPRAARTLAAHLAGHPAPALLALCLSARVAEALAGLARVRVAAAPTEAALLALLDPPDK